MTIIDSKAYSESVNMSEISAENICTKLLREMDGAYPSSLGINLGSMVSEEIFKWFIASILLGARGDEDIAAMNTYRVIERAGILSVKAVMETGRENLVNILNQSGYIRCNHKTATKLLKATGALKEKYGGDLNRLHFFARGGRDLERKLQNLEKDINTVTVSIFLRGLRGVWDKVELPFSIPAFWAARNLGLTHSIDAAVALEELKTIWEQDETSLLALEAALVKLGKNYCYQDKCLVCFMRDECKNIRNKEVIKITMKPELGGR